MITRRPSVFGPLTDIPRGARVAAGVVAVAFGVVCVLRPFLSLAAVAVVATVGLAAALACGVARHRAVPAPATAAVLLVVAAGALLAPDAVLTVAPFVLIAVGLGTVVLGRRDRVSAVLGGAVAVGAGVLALLWPDMAAYVLAVLFGLVMVLTGLWLVVGGRAPRRRPWLARSASGLALAGTLVLLFASGAVLYAAPGFAVTPPAPAPTGPGKLVSAQPLTSGLPAGAHGWRILYTTERADGSPTVASGLVAVGGDPGVQRPVVAWAHGTTGYSGACGPSTLPDPLLATGAGSGLADALQQGAALVATDYPGLSTPGPQPYLIGVGEGRAVLDAVRAARDVPGLALRDQVLIWGHSQGGHAALWAGELAPTYAPDLTVLGVAALAPAADLPAVAAHLDTVPGGTIFLSYLLRAYADTYPDVRLGAVLPPGGQVVVRGLAERCLTAPAAAVSLTSSTLFGPLLTGPLDGTALGTRLAENVPAARIAVPVLIAQGSADVLVPRASQDGFVRRLCGTGTAVTYRTYPGVDHGGIVAAGSPALPDLIAWSRARLAGAPVAAGC